MSGNFDFTTDKLIPVLELAMLYEQLTQEEIAIPTLKEVEKPGAILMPTASYELSNDFFLSPSDKLSELEWLRAVSERFQTDAFMSIPWKGDWVYVCVTPNGSVYQIKEDAEGDWNFSDRELIISAPHVVAA